MEKKNRPTEINVAGVPFKISYHNEQPTGSGVYGTCHSRKGEISLSNDMPDGVMNATLIHEWIHGVLNLYGVDHGEPVADVLSNELNRIGFKPPVIKWGKKK